MVLSVNNLTGFGSGGLLTSSPDLYAIIQAHGLASSCVVCLDAGNSTSYTSGQLWNDLSGNSHDYNLGLSPSGDGLDPTFNGAAGSYGTTNYWTFPGGDQFWENTSPTPTFADDWHKAGAQWSIIVIFYLQTGTSRTKAVWGTQGTGTQGVSLVTTTTPTLRLRHSTDNSTLASETISSPTLATDSWSVWGLSIDDTTMNYVINSTDGSQAISASTATNANISLIIGGTDTVTQTFESSDRMMAIALFQGAIGQSNLRSIYQHLKYNRIAALP